jgi:hypothetical protein
MTYRSDGMQALFSVARSGSEAALRGPYSTPTITLLALMLAWTSFPCSRPSDRAELSMMVETISIPGVIWIVTSVLTGPCATLVTVP